jgi:hypothetical protein
MYKESELLFLVGYLLFVGILIYVSLIIFEQCKKENISIENCKHKTRSERTKNELLMLSEKIDILINENNSLKNEINELKYLFFLKTTSSI